MDVAEPPEGFNSLSDLIRDRAGYLCDDQQQAHREPERNGKGKTVRPWIRADTDCYFTAEDDPWPLHQEEHARSACGADLEPQGERCVGVAMDAGFAAISHLSHNHKPENMAKRYGLLVNVGVPGVLYISDNETTGILKAQRSFDTPAGVGLPCLHLPAATIWTGGIVEKGSINDAPGDPVDHWGDIRAPFCQAIADLGAAGHEVVDLVEAAEEKPAGKHRRLAPDEVVTLLFERIGTPRLNILSGEILLHVGAIPGNNLGRLYLDLSNTQEAWTKDTTNDAVVHLAQANVFDPVADYLNGMEPKPEARPLEDWSHQDLQLLNSDHPPPAPGRGGIRRQRPCRPAVLLSVSRSTPCRPSCNHQNPSAVAARKDDAHVTPAHSAPGETVTIH